MALFRCGGGVSEHMIDKGEWIVSKAGDSAVSATPYTSGTPFTLSGDYPNGLALINTEDFNGTLAIKPSRNAIPIIYGITDGVISAINMGTTINSNTTVSYDVSAYDFVVVSLSATGNFSSIEFTLTSVL